MNLSYSDIKRAEREENHRPELIQWRHDTKQQAATHRQLQRATVKHASNQLRLSHLSNKQKMIIMGTKSEIIERVKYDPRLCSTMIYHRFQPWSSQRLRHRNTSKYVHLILKKINTKQLTIIIMIPMQVFWERVLFLALRKQTNC